MTKAIGRHRTGAGPTDAELLIAVRAGDTSAFGVLYERHSDAARRLARVLVRDLSDADDLVAEAFAKVLAALRLGRGPDVAFRAYLLTAVRHTCYDRTRRDRRIEFTEDLTKYEGAGGPTAGDQVVARLDRSYAARAFAKLPERWQVVLWHTEVEGEKPATIAPLLGLSPNAVAALAYRARERLRQIYLQEHLNEVGDPSCLWTTGRLGAHVRHGLPHRERSKVDAHLAGCDGCRALWAELAELNRGLRGVLAPVVLGAVATPYLTTVPATAWWAGVVATVREWWSLALDRVHGLVQRQGSANVAAGAGIVAAAVVGVTLFALAAALGPPPDPTEVEPPAAAEPDPPVPAPAPEPPPASRPAPVEPPPASPTRPTGETAQPAPTSAPSPSPSPSPRPSRPPVQTPVRVAPDLPATRLAAGETGQLAITVRMPAGPATATASPASPASAASIMVYSHDTPDDSPNKLHDRAERAEVAEIVVGWPAEMALAGTDAGSGWRCVAGEPGGAVCQRPAWPAGESRPARIPVIVGEALGGLAPITVTVTAGGQRSAASFRVPVAPAGLGVAYAGSGQLGVAMAGNTWLSCPTRPECLRDDRLDNNVVPPRPYLPGAGEPAVPPGLTGQLVAASGAHLPVPAGAGVAWAALHWATTAAEGPDQVRLHGPAGGWHAISADAVQLPEGRPLRQAYADVTELVRDAGSGPWWVATTTGPLPTSGRLSAGWSLTVVYEGTAHRDVAVFTGPMPLSGERSLSVSTGANGEQVEVGLVVWEGDRTLTGDRLRLDDQPLGDPDNALASRAAGALECGAEPAASCGWHTFGVDVAQHRGTGSDGGAVSLHTERDLLEIGVLVLAVDTSG